VIKLSTRKLPVSLLNLEFSEDGSLYLNGIKQVPNIRRLAELTEVLFDRDFAQGADLNQPIYFMYRDVTRPIDRQLFLEMRLRYDITIMLPKTLGVEFNKTLGHYHPKASDALTYMEVYEVLYGEAHYLLQKVDGNRVIDAALVEAKEGDKVVIPSGYGHITINPSTENCLVMSNLVYRDFESIYEPIKKMKGGVVYELTSGKLVVNSNYELAKDVQRVKPDEGFSLKFNGRDLYSLFIERPDSFVFLKDPSRY